MKKKTTLLTIIIAGMLFGSFFGLAAEGTTQTEEVLVVEQSPYCDIDWDEVYESKGITHAHTSANYPPLDEDAEGSWTGDKHAVNESVLHHEEKDVIDWINLYNHSSSSYPWDAWDDVDTDEIDLDPIHGVEHRQAKHICSLFTPHFRPDDKDELDDVNETLEFIDELGGLSYFAHPNDAWYYDDPSYPRDNHTVEEMIDWWYSEYDSLVGQAIFSGRGREKHWEVERPLYDELVKELGKERPIYAFSELDNRLSYSRLNHLLVEDNTQEEYRNAIENGEFFWSYNVYDTDMPEIEKIETGNGEIRLHTDEDHRERRWVYMNETVATGDVFTADDMVEGQNYVRLEIGEWESEPEYVLGTQPFYITTGDIETETEEPFEITHDSAILQGEISKMDIEEVDVYFRYRKYGQEDWQSSEKQTLKSTGTFEQKVENLREDTYYEFKAVAEWGGNDGLYETTGEVLFFETLSIYRPPPSLSIISPEDSVENLTYEENLTIEGITDPESSVKIDGEEVEVSDETGHFEKIVELNEGLNIIEVIASDENDSTTVEKVYAQYMPEIPEIWEEIEYIFKTVGRIENDLNELEEEHKERLNELENDLNENITTLQEALNRLGNLEEVHDGLQQEISEVKSNITEIKNEIVDLKEESDDEETDFGLLEGALIINSIILALLVIIMIFYIYPKLKTQQNSDENDLKDSDEESTKDKDD